MIVSFYDKNFKALQNNSGLAVDIKSYSLIKRPVDMNEFKCTCEAFTENIQPTFLIVKDNRGSNSLVYASLAGIPILNNKNQTEVNGTDIKSMLSSDILVEQNTFDNVNEYITYIFNQWNEQVNQNSFTCVLRFNDNVGNVDLTDLKPELEKSVEKKNAWDEISSYLKFYNLFMDTQIDLVNKHVIFIIGRTMFRNVNIKLWEYGIRNYGKWVADTNECQGYYAPDTITSLEQLNDDKQQYKGYKWILTSQNKITTDETNRDIYPIKRKVVLNSESKEQADREALTKLLDSLYNENIEIPTTNISPDFETAFFVFVEKGKEEYCVYPNTDYYAIDDTSFSSVIGQTDDYVNADKINIKGEEYWGIKIDGVDYLVKENVLKPRPYKILPCGELHYDGTGLVKVQIGYRYTDVSFI